MGKARLTEGLMGKTLVGEAHGSPPVDKGTFKGKELSAGPLLIVRRQQSFYT